LTDVVFLPHRMFERDREGAMAENHNCRSGFVRCQKRVGKCERKSRVWLDGVHHLLVPTLQRSWPVRAVRPCCRGLRVRRSRNETCEAKHHSSSQVTKKGSAWLNVLSIEG